MEMSFFTCKKQFNLSHRFISLFLLFLSFLSFIEANENQNFPHAVDVVYTWVDNSDKDWLAIKNSHLKSDGVIGNISDSSSNNRFNNHDELRYSLRSILQYASFVNHIYIVTMNQRPSWLVDHPKITIIDHKEIFENSDNLPTFNSQAIECNLDRIPNLQEHFIYLNDDFFLGGSVIPEDFFTEKGEVKVMFTNKPGASGPGKENESAYTRACRNTNNLLNSCFKKEPRNSIKHGPYALKKSYIQESKNEFPSVFAITSSHRFRSMEDYTITNGFLQYHWFYKRKIMKSSLTSTVISLGDDYKKTKSKFKMLKELNPKTFCIQDSMVKGNEKSIRLLHEYLEERFPNPAPWEQ